MKHTIGGEYVMTAVMPLHVVEEAKAHGVAVSLPLLVRRETVKALAEFEQNFGFSLVAACLHPELRRMLLLGLPDPTDDDGVCEAMMDRVAEDFEA